MYREMALAELVTVPGGRGGSTSPAAAADAGYRSRFGNWQERASVRVKPQRMLDTTDDRQLYFPPELVAVAGHPLVLRRGEAAQRRLLIHRLYSLHFTTELEEAAVMPIACKISRGRSGVDIPESMRYDAFKIITDEAWHAQFSYDLMRQIVSKTGVECAMPPLPQFIERLDSVRHHLPVEVRGAEALLFAIVSETLISSILADVPRDRRLPDAVRRLVADHSEDEGRHHAYFRSLLGYFWSALDPKQRHELGARLPEVILAFLEPDYRALAVSLADIGLGREEIEQALCESYPGDEVRRGAAAAASATVRYFTEIGALDDQRTAEAFHAAGLTPAGR